MNYSIYENTEAAAFCKMIQLVNISDEKIKRFQDRYREKRPQIKNSNRPQ